jgi:hypothetical protein
MESPAIATLIKMMETLPEAKQKGAFTVIYELRTYWAAPGKIENLHQRFRSLTLGVFARHGMEVVGFWTPTPATDESGDLVYIMRFADEAAKEAAWDAFRADPQWIEGKAASEKDGALVVKLTSIVLQSTDYGPRV